MRLKRVKIFGFKTFADRTEFDLDGNVVAVVGPNGCGKSNLVDAILWGLGEGNARQLRAQSGQDVIFSGSARRKGVGFAEVTLLFDNEDGSLPIDAPEVSITRRLTRGGDTDYAISRQPCRQRDVYDLLADSGLGRAGYAIVGQKEIDQAVAASPHERRAWVDEAAGVQRYRARKLESQRRLAAAETHLTRVCDILTELGAQREPLREEAEVARRYKVSLDALRSVESGLLIREVAQALRESAELEARIGSATKVSVQAASTLESSEAEARASAAQAIELERAIESSTHASHEASSRLERAESNLRLASQRLESLDEIERSLGDEATAWAQRIAEALAESQALAAEENAEREARERTRQDCAGADAEAKELTRQLKATEARLAQGREDHARRLKLDAEKAHRKERSIQAKRELLGIDLSLPELESAVAEANGTYDQAAQLVATGQELRSTLQAELDSIRADQDRHAADSRRKLADRAALEGRARGIEATIDQHEGLNQGARAVLEAVGQGALHGNYVPVGGAIEVSREHAMAVETALGGSSNDLIVDDENVAQRAIEWLKANRMGRATFQPIPLMRPVDLGDDGRRVLARKGVVGRASDLVRCSAGHRPVIESLLGRVLVVVDLDTALALAKTAGWNRLVTLDGEVVHHSGSVTGGRTGKQMYGLVQRKADLTEIQGSIQALDAEIATIEKRVVELQEARDGVAARIAEIQEAAQALQTEADEARNYWQQLAEELSSAVKGRARLIQELEKLDLPDVDSGEKVDVPALEEERDAILKSLAARTADSEQAEARLKEADARLAQAGARLQQADKRLAAAKEAERTGERKLGHVEPERVRHRVEIAHFESEIAKAQTLRSESEGRLASLRKDKDALAARAVQISQAISEARQTLAAVGDALHQAELNRARTDAKRAGAAQRLFEEYSLTEDDAIAAEATVDVPADAAAVVARLRRDLRSMGDVNLGSVEAFDRLTTRFDELDVQRADIVAGIEEVHRSILELDKLTREKFLSTFEQLQGHFADLFQQLFPGGEGRLSLIDGESTLETGIDIEVTLPGKKRQRMDLLSGGERALCASAFLFSLLRAKPSPLVVLDEVDAPLDGRNVERFAAVLHEFSDHIQFLLITHNQTTIASAPIWLGVTMNEPGVSTLVPMRVPERAIRPNAAILA